MAGINTWVALDDLSAINTVAPELSYETYTVADGDTLWGIASRKLGSGSRYTEIMTLNGLNSSVITIGQKLKLPK